MKRAQNDQGRRKIDDSVLNRLYEPAMVIKNGIEEKGYNSVLFSSVDERTATVEAAVHISYLLTQLNKKVLVVNLDYRNLNLLKDYLEPNKNPSLISQLKESAYISESIAQTQYANLDLIEVEEISDDEFATTVNDFDFKSKLQPITNYYDVLIVIGPETASFEYYANVYELADSALTIVNDQRNGRKALKAHVDKLGLFNIRSFGIIKKCNK